MKRRDFFKSMVAASLGAKAALAQQDTTPNSQKQATNSASDADDPEVPRVRGLLEAKPLPVGTLVADEVAETTAHFFTEQQMATLRRLSDLMMPPLRGKPGALDAGAPEFLDFLIGVSPDERQQMYKAGLDWLDQLSRKEFAEPFAEIDGARAHRVLLPWMRAWMPDHPPTEPNARFLNIAHMDIREATKGSEAWHRALVTAGRKDTNIGLYWFPVDPDLRNVAPAIQRPQNS
jgi:Gluconate 2-dehydrogenase subunit 3